MLCEWNDCAFLTVFMYSTGYSQQSGVQLYNIIIVVIMCHAVAIRSVANLLMVEYLVKRIMHSQQRSY
jgi:hypothetical protein